MKKIYIIFLSIIVTINYYGCRNEEKLNLEKIINYVEQIKNNIKNFKKIEVPVMGLSPEGGFAIGYLAEDIICYIEAYFYGEMSRLTFNIFIIPDIGLYIMKEKEMYDKPSYFDDYKIIDVNTNFMIIVNDQVFETNELLNEYKANESLKDYLKYIREVINIIQLEAKK